MTFEESFSLQFIHNSNILNALLVLAAAVRGMPSVFRGHLSEAFISAYLLLFALLLLLFETNNLRFENKLRKNYGFLFTYKGRGCFLLLIGLLSLGLANLLFGYVVAGYTLLNAIVNLVVLQQNPQWRLQYNNGRAAEDIAGGLLDTGFFTGADPDADDIAAGLGDTEEPRTFTFSASNNDSNSKNFGFDENGRPVTATARQRTKTITTMHLGNMLNAAVIVFTGFDGMPSILFGHVSSAFIAAYLLLFGLMMFGFELQIHCVEERLRSEYGFLFTRKGRCLFILFIGLLNFGIEYSAFSKVVGFGTIFNAGFNYIVLFANPQWCEDNLRNNQQGGGRERDIDTAFHTQLGHAFGMSGQGGKYSHVPQHHHSFSPFGAAGVAGAGGAGGHSIVDTAMSLNAGSSADSESHTI